MARVKQATKPVDVIDQAEAVANTVTLEYNAITRESFAPTFAEIDRIIDWTIARVPKALRLTERANASLIAYIATKAQKNCYGYFQPDAYTLHGRAVHQVTLCLETFREGIEQIVETIIHEVGHAHNRLAGIRDCNANIHNLRFKDTAEQFGLIVEKGGASVGWGITRMGSELRDAVFNELKPDARLFQLMVQTRKPKTKPPTKMVKWSCDCTIVRCATALDATCGECGEVFAQE
jgi:hypothetical protein